MTPDLYAALDLYLGAFAARQDAYVKDSHVTIKEPLTPEVAAAAFGVGGFSVSGYMATYVVPPDCPTCRSCMTHVAAIDFDMDDGMEKAREVRHFLGSQHDIDTLLVSSRRGAHLWVTTIGDGTHGSQAFGLVPASVLRRALKSALVLCGITDEKAEVFPKKSESDWGVGALRMPLMRHPKTGVRYPAYDPSDDRPITLVRDIVNVMADVQSQTAYAALYGLAGPPPGPMSYPGRGGLQARPSLTAEDMPLVSDLLMRYLGVEARPGTSIKCPFHPDQHASLSVADDDRRIWCKAPECPIYNGDDGMGSLGLLRHLGKEIPRVPAAPSPDSERISHRLQG